MMRIAAGLLRGAFNLIISAFYAVTGGINRLMHSGKTAAAVPVRNYEPDFKDSDSQMDYSLPPGLVEHHSQDDDDAR